VRFALTLLTLGTGLTLAFVSYFFLAAPLGIPVDERFSNPRMPFAAGLFVFGVLLCFLSAVVYELLPQESGG